MAHLELDYLRVVGSTLTKKKEKTPVYTVHCVAPCNINREFWVIISYQ